MTMKYTADISPAIAELKKLHIAMMEHVNAKLTATQPHGLSDDAGLQEARDTVISIVPKDRRRELGWYKFRMWEKKSDAIVELLDPTYKGTKYHEIFIAGEALKVNPEDLVTLMMHQVIHQAAGIPSEKSYHGEWVKPWGERLFDIEQEAWSREEVLGWVNLDLSKAGQDARDLVKTFASNIAIEHVYMFRDALPASKNTGKMYLWVCDCKSPKVRTGGVLRATCDVCGGKYKFQDSKKVSWTWYTKIPSQYRG